VRRRSAVEESRQRLRKTPVRSCGLGRKRERFGASQIGQKIGGDTHGEKGVGGGAPAWFTRRPVSFDVGGGQKALRGSGGGGL
jgi:hypothetical protein